ncbi:MAG TPA: hypothetical protein VER17_05070 [Tepidisphaeraceae bacterium]|nr:hypothetical protein [Tepidisphaeraceae bacterium]
MPDALNQIARRHGVSADAARHVLDALRASGGRLAQFNHPELGGQGQWMSGMVMIGDMFNAPLKAKVAALCEDLAAVALRAPGGRSAFAASPPPAPPGAWWPATMGTPAASGAQHGVRYAYFANHRRLLIERAGAILAYDTGNHVIQGVAQQQPQAAGGDLVFTSQLGTVPLDRLPVVPPPGRDAPA